MPETIDIHCLPHELQVEEVLIAKTASALAVSVEQVSSIRITKRSIDARKQPVIYRLRIEAFLNGEEMVDEPFTPGYQQVPNAKEIAIVGFGPAGIFAALECLKLGLKPVVFERGKDV
ncbi:MAG: FAD-binding protein, partial [Flavobacteriales bacterium]